MWLTYALTISFTILTLIGLWVYLGQKKDAYKFFYPALVLFVLFSLVPISYSVYVSFTNLKTGHLLERKNVVALFLEEKIVERDAPYLDFKLFKNSDQYLIKVGDLSSLFKANNEKVILTTTPQDLSSFQLLSPDEILNFIEEHKEIVFDHPKLGALNFFRTDILTKIKPRYKLNGQNQIIDQISGKTLDEDINEGQFKLEGESIGPGYYTLVGFKNYKDLLFDKELSFVFFKTFGWTFAWAFLSVLLSFSVGAFLAVILNEFSERTKLAYRMFFIIPYSIPFFISVLVFKGLLNKDFGEINSLLSIFKISPIPWLDNKIWARISVLMVNLWLGFPYMLLVITGILQSIPKTIYEASSLEGASKWQNFRYLTFPLVIRSMVPLLIGSFAFNLNNFVGIYLLTGGGPVIPSATTPLGETDILISYTYRLAFEGSQGQNFATAAAVSMFIFIIVITITLFNFKISKVFSKKQI